MLGGQLLARRHNTHGVANVEHDQAAFLSLDRGVEELPFFILEFFEDNFPFGFAELLDDYLFGRLGSHAAIRGWREEFGADDVANSRAFLQGLRIGLGNFGFRVEAFEHRFLGLCFGCGFLCRFCLLQGMRFFFAACHGFPGGNFCGSVSFLGFNFRFAFGIVGFGGSLLGIFHNRLLIENPARPVFQAEVDLDILVFLTEILAVCHGECSLHGVDDRIHGDAFFVRDLLHCVDNWVGSHTYVGKKKQPHSRAV